MADPNIARSSSPAHLFRRRAFSSVRLQVAEAHRSTAGPLTSVIFTAAIRDPNPVVRCATSESQQKILSLTYPRSSQLFLEPKILYRSAVEQVPTGDFQLPLSSAEVLREGSDLTIVSYGPPLYTIEGALHLLKNPTEDIQSLIPEDLRHLSVELIDLRTIAPYDIETIVKSVNKTGRCLVVHEAVKTGGVGSELAAEVQERCFLRLEAPVQRITGWDTPFGMAYEKFYLPDQLRIVSSVALGGRVSTCILTLLSLRSSTPS